MGSKLDNILLETKSLIRLKAIKDFPFNTPKMYRITHAQPSRVMFKDGKLACTTEDCITGMQVDGKPQECASCIHKTNGDCSYKCLVYFEHKEPEKEYVLAIPFTAQYALSEYVKLLLADDLDAPDVITAITRVKTDDDKSTYKFELADLIKEEEVLELTDVEQESINDLVVQLRLREMTMDVEEFAETLPYTDGLVGISSERATSIAKSIAKDGMIR
jgi:hypothetical protein